MTALAPDPTRCPDCLAALTGRRCGGCSLVLTGPDAARLWAIDVALLALDGRRGDLQAERAGVLERLRAGDGPARVPAQRAPVPAVPPAEWTPQRVQNVLLTLGGLLLAGAGLVFTAVTYERLGAAGRSVVLVVLTVLAAAAAPRLRARGLQATAEALGGVALALAALDAYGLRTLGVAAGSDPLTYAAGSAAVLAVLAGACARAVPLRVLQAAAVLVAQLPALLLLVRDGATPATAALVLAGLAAVDLAVLRGLPVLPPAARTALAVAGGGALALGLLTACVAATEGPAGAAAGALAACAAVLVLAGTAVTDRARRGLLTGSAVPVLGLAAWTLASPAAAPLVLAAVGLVAVLGAAQLPRAERPGPALGSLLVSAAGLAAVAPDALRALLLPLSWLADPWSLAPGLDLRAALSPGQPWDGTLAVPVVLLAAALATTAAALALHRLRAAAAPAAVLGAGTVVLLPLGLDLGRTAGFALLLVLAGALAAAGTAVGRARSTSAGTGLAAAGTAVALLTAAWSTASQGATLTVLPLVTLGVAALAATRLGSPPATTALAGLLGAATTVAAGASRGLAPDQVGALLLAVVAALLGGGLLLDRSRRAGTDLAAAAVAASALLLTSPDVGWLSWSLAGTGLLALATALRADRRVVAPLGALLLAASSWVRLHDAGTTSPEPYVLPLAALALLLGHLRRRQVPATASWAAYGLGLSLALLPSLLASFVDTTLERPLLLGLGALVVLLVGARARLQAPLVVGGAVLLVDALQLLAPYAAALPRWLSLGTAGALLVAVGATYEQRLRDVGRLRERYDALS